MIVAEHWIEHIARTLNLRPEVVRERNLYASPNEKDIERRKTHYGQVSFLLFFFRWRSTITYCEFMLNGSLDKPPS